LDDDTGPSPHSTSAISLLTVLALVVAAVMAVNLEGSRAVGQPRGALAGEASNAAPADSLTDAPGGFFEYVHPAALSVVVVLLFLSGFFSGSETAFCSLHRVRLRAMREEEGFTGKRVAAMMDHPGRLLTTILVGNTIVNVLIAVTLGTRVESYVASRLPEDLPSVWSYVSAVALVTAVLVLFGEIAPKVIALRASEKFARLAVVPLTVSDRVLGPIRQAMLRLTDEVFRLVRLHELHAAPFITDEELKSALSSSEAEGVIEQEDREMIQGILELKEAVLREILVPRPDIEALPADATIEDALARYREHGFSRMPVYEESLDNILGVLVVKDLLPRASREPETLVKSLARQAYFAPETMGVHEFVREAQARHNHMAIVVDEYGGTAGIVTLEDAMQEVVGRILEEGEHEQPPYEQLDERVYRVDGGLPLDELSELLGMEIEDEEHETVAGFVMNQIDKIPEVGDRIEHPGGLFTVEECDGKRASTVRIELPEPAEEAESE
jgi:CBS domain containing-hemolysin-like protein